MSEPRVQRVPATRLERVGTLFLFLLFLSLPLLRAYQIGLGPFLVRVAGWMSSSGWPWVNAPRGLLVVSGVMLLVLAPRVRSGKLRATLLVLAYSLLLPTLLGTGSSSASFDLLQMGLLLGASALMGVIQAIAPKQALVLYDHR